MSADNGIVDLFIIGGGVNGAGIARDAAGRGMSVVLCEKDDLAQGTSSRSGKLVHGGLRYLEYYEFRLVREALIEREVLLEFGERTSSGRCASCCPTAPIRSSGLARPTSACFSMTISVAANVCRVRVRWICRQTPEGAAIMRDQYTQGLRIFRLLGR